MQLVKPSVKFMDMNQLGESLIEMAGRTCHKSEDKITDSSHIEFIRRMAKMDHDAMIEFSFLVMRVICDRGVTHEIVRPRLFSYAQESTRHCNYKGGVTFIIPFWLQTILDVGQYQINLLRDIIKVDDITFKFSQYEIGAQHWLKAMLQTELAYSDLLNTDWKPQQARSVLPNSLKTEICIGGNAREWKHFFELRLDEKAHPQMREVALMAYEIALEKMPTVFETVWH